MHSPQAFQGAALSEQLPATDSAEPAELEDALTEQSPSRTERPAEQVSDKQGSQIEVEPPKSADQLCQAMAKLFEPAQRCKVRLAEIANASDSIFRLVGSALERLEELESFRDHMRKLSNLFASMRAFQDDLGVLAESFDPVKALHQQVVQIAEGVRTGLAEVAASLELANTLRAQTGELTKILEVGAELQAQFHELSKAFGGPIQVNDESVGNDRGGTA